MCITVIYTLLMVTRSIQSCSCIMCRFGMDRGCQNPDQTVRAANAAAASKRERDTIEWLKNMFANATVEKE